MSRLGKTLGARAYGIAFLVLVLVFVWLTYAVFTKKFTPYDEVTLKTSSIGLSLPARADVKIRGVQVGEVLSATTDGDGAKLVLGLYPDQTSTIPENVSATILPKTLFGEKYVALDVPQDPKGTIQAGDTISQSQVAIELERVLNDLFPLLRTVRPEQLNYTLTAVANALEGRGEKIGQSFETLDGYLEKLNPRIPALIDSLDKLGKVSAVYESVTPDLTNLLRNTVTTTHTFESREQQVKALFNDVAGFSATAETFLKENGDNIVTLADQGRRILPLLARYSPEYKCFLAGAVASIHPNEQAFRNKVLHIILETLPRQPRTYNVSDQPSMNDHRGPFPYCGLMYAAINGKYGQDNLPPNSIVPKLNDGTNYSVPLGKRAAVGPSVSDVVVGTAQNKGPLNMAAAAVLGVPVRQVPDVASLLLGPLAQGKAVDVR
jgi:phospholipid/cholesterol/gamma-HCH transport system substrate-binding protein